MENALLALQLILALLLVGVVLLQRSEGGGLGMGSGGGGGVVSGRAAATALGKLTWAIAAAFIASSIALTILSAKDAATSSVIDQIGGTSAPAEVPAPAETLDLGAVPSTPPADAVPAAPPKVNN